jgi:hypothetical protein
MAAVFTPSPSKTLPSVPSRVFHERAETTNISGQQMSGAAGELRLEYGAIIAAQ